MRDVDSSTKLVDGKLILEDGVYDILRGFESSDDHRKYTRKNLTEHQARNDPLWFALARNDHELLDAYVSATFKKVKDRYGINTTAMGVYLSDSSKKTFLRPWWLARLDADVSSACGYYRLDYDGGRVVGVAPLNKK